MSDQATAKTSFSYTAGELFVIAGPCAIESRAFALETAHQLREIFGAAGVPFIYKSSFDKANRTSLSSFRGVGIAEGLDILSEVRDTVQVPVLTDVHEVDQVEPVSQAVDMLQTPAFLCRQTDFIRAVAQCGKPVNIKKGQFLAPWDMKNVIGKARESAREAGHGDTEFFACERGTSFGYGNLVVDMRGLTIMQQTSGAPVVFDATHSVQLPGAEGNSSGGDRRQAPALARAAVASGAVAGLFMEAHPNPDQAPCDGPNMLPFEWLPQMLQDLKTIHAATQDCLRPAA